MKVRVVGPVVFPERKAEQQELAHDSNHAGFAAGLAGAQAGVEDFLLRVMAQAAHGRQVEGRAQAHVSSPGDARGPRQLFQKLGGQGFIDYIADYYLEQQPAEASRIDRGAVVFALTYGIDYSRLDDTAERNRV